MSRAWAPVRKGRVRLLVHSDRAHLFLGRLRAEFPAVEAAVCDSYAGVAEVLCAIRPQIVLSHKFENARYPGKVVAGFDSVEWIHCGGTGVEHFGAWDPDFLTITNSPGVPAKVMSEFAIAAIYALNLHYPRYMRQQFRHAWGRGSVRQTEGGTVAVIGLGRIGRAICVRAKAAGLTVIGVRAGKGHVKETDRTLSADRLHEALASADYVVIVVPRTRLTTNLIDRAALDAMKPSVLLVNLSRGGVVDEAALLDALRSGHVRGAALDVFDQEPLPPESPFWDLENVIVTPHSAGFVEGWEAPVRELFCGNLARWLEGSPLRDVVEPEARDNPAPQTSAECDA